MFLRFGHALFYAYRRGPSGIVAELNSGSNAVRMYGVHISHDLQFMTMEVRQGTGTMPRIEHCVPGRPKLGSVTIGNLRVNHFAARALASIFYFQTFVPSPLTARDVPDHLSGLSLSAAFYHSTRRKLRLRRVKMLALPFCNHLGYLGDK